MIDPPAFHVVETDAQQTEKRFRAALERSDGSLKEAVIEAEALATKFGYSNSEIGALVKRTEYWVRHIRKWGARGFIGTPFDKANKPDSRDPSHRSSGARPHDPLKTNENPYGEDDSGEDDPQDEDPKGFVLAVIRNATEKVNIAIRNLSPDFTDGDQSEIVEAIDALIRKWESVKRRLRVKEAPRT